MSTSGGRSEGIPDRAHDALGVEEVSPGHADDDVAEGPDPVLALLLPEERIGPTIRVLDLAVELEEHVGALDAQVDTGDDHPVTVGDAHLRVDAVAGTTQDRASDALSQRLRPPIGPGNGAASPGRVGPRGDLAQRRLQRVGLRGAGVQGRVDGRDPSREPWSIVSCRSEVGRSVAGPQSVSTDA